MHAAASYNLPDLLRALVNEFRVNVDLKDEDGETALFVTETIECARVLVEELHVDITVRGDEGKTALESITEENSFPEVAVYLRSIELERQVQGARPITPEELRAPVPLPEGVTVNFGSMNADEAGEVTDPEFKRAIDELAARDDFAEEEGQAQLRALIVQAIRGSPEDEEHREVRRRVD